MFPGSSSVGFEPTECINRTIYIQISPGTLETILSTLTRFGSSKCFPHLTRTVINVVASLLK